MQLDLFLWQFGHFVFLRWGSKMVKQQSLCGEHYGCLCSSEFFTSCGCEVRTCSAQRGISAGFARLYKKQKAGLLFFTTCVQRERERERKYTYIYLYIYLVVIGQAVDSVCASIQTCRKVQLQCSITTRHVFHSMHFHFGTSLIQTTSMKTVGRTLSLCFRWLLLTAMSVGGGWRGGHLTHSYTFDFKCSHS